MQIKEINSYADKIIPFKCKKNWKKIFECHISNYHSRFLEMKYYLLFFLSSILISTYQLWVHSARLIFSFGIFGTT